MRVSIYEFILEALERDANLEKPYSKYFPNVTEKDKITQSFFAHMLNSQFNLIERAKQFELQCFP